MTAPATSNDGWALRLRIGDVPVRVELSFFLIVGVLGYGVAVQYERGEVVVGATAQRLAVWVGVVLVSIIVHELGHAVVMRLSGVGSHIVVHGMGGLTFPASHIRSRSRRIAVSLAGPLSGLFLLGIPALWVGRTIADPSDLVDLLLFSLVWVNVVWSFVNLLPILPLDGGNVTKEVLDAVTGEQGEVPARIISIVVAALGGLYALRSGLIFAGMFALFFVATNFRVLSERRSGQVAVEVRDAYAALANDDCAAALTTAWATVPRAKAPALRAAAVEIAAWAHVGLGDADAARQVLGRMPPNHEPSGHLRAVIVETDPAERVNATVDEWLSGATTVPPPTAYVRALAGDRLLDPVIERLLAARADTAPKARTAMSQLLVVAGLLSDAARFGPPEVGPDDSEPSAI